MNEAVEVALANKILGAANGDCSNIKQDGFMDFCEARNNKKRFLSQALKSLDSGGTVPSRIFSSLDDTSADRELGKNDICAVVNKQSEKAAKEMMQDCPEGAADFQSLLGKQKAMEKISDVALSEACHTVEKLQRQACESSQKTVEPDADKEPSRRATIKKSSGESMGSTAVAQ
jgi:hypothetical protein